MSDKKVFVCSWALALSTVRAKAQLRTLINIKISFFTSQIWQKNP
nr:hypothetical protein [Okeania sp. SIO2F4]